MADTPEFKAPVLPPEADKPRDLFGELTQGDDDPEAHEPGDAELASLQEEFQALAALKRRVAALESQLSEAKEAYEGQRTRMLDALEGQGTKQFASVDGQGSCSISEVFSTTVEDPQALMEWAKSNHPELLSIHSGTRNRFIREEFRDRGVPPDDPSFPPGLAVGTIRRLTVRGIK
jgi:hypothetical protein